MTRYLEEIMLLSRMFRWFNHSQDGQKRKARVINQRRLRLEPLEKRNLLSVTISGTIAVSNLPCATKITTTTPCSYMGTFGDTYRTFG